MGVNYQVRFDNFSDVRLNFKLTFIRSLFSLQSSGTFSAKARHHSGKSAAMDACLSSALGDTNALLKARCD
jgi:hypothetical protein